MLQLKIHEICCLLPSPPVCYICVSDESLQRTCVTEKLQSSLTVDLLESFNEVPQRVAPFAKVQKEEVPWTATRPGNRWEREGEEDGGKERGVRRRGARKPLQANHPV